MKLSKDFALIGPDGYFRYPYIVKKRGGYSCTTKWRKTPAPGKYYTPNIEEVIRGIIFDGWSVRCAHDAEELPVGVKLLEGGIGFQKKGFNNYWVSSKYEYLVDKAPVPPTSRPGLPPEQIDPIVLKAAEAEIDADPMCKGVSETERERLVKARIGQGEYRKGVLELWNHRCALTGLPVETALVASHAKPWSVSENNERINPYNGLLLAASVDRLFDRGLISFSDDGEVLLGPQVTEADLALIGVSPGARLSDHLNDQHKPFLQEHRKLFGFE